MYRDRAGFFTICLFDMGSQSLKNLLFRSANIRIKQSTIYAYLQLDLGLGNILLASTTIGDLLGLSDLGTDGIGAEVLDRVTFGGVDAHDRVGLNSSESTGNCI